MTKPKANGFDVSRKTAKMTGMGTFTISFGQYKGKPLSQIPVAYLQWVLMNSRHMIKPALARAIVQELEGTFLPGDMPINYYDISKTNYEKYMRAEQGDHHDG